MWWGFVFWEPPKTTKSRDIQRKARAGAKRGGGQGAGALAALARARARAIPCSNLFPVAHKVEIECADLEG